MDDMDPQCKINLRRLLVCRFLKRVVNQRHLLCFHVHTTCLTSGLFRCLGQSGTALSLSQSSLLDLNTQDHAYICRSPIERDLMSCACCAVAKNIFGQIGTNSCYFLARNNLTMSIFRSQLCLREALFLCWTTICDICVALLWLHVHVHVATIMWTSRVSWFMPIVSQAVQITVRSHTQAQW